MKTESETLFLTAGASGFLKRFQSFLRQQVLALKPLAFVSHRELCQSISYTLLGNGKRFRPLLCWSVAGLWGVRLQDFLPWACAVEMMHTASLIHDDLPLMDNALQRRGRACNHRRFGEQTAFLAASSLWIEAFRMLTLRPAFTHSWLKILCRASGMKGLMGGQMLDLKPPLKKTDFYYKKMHEMKTAGLISASMEGVRILKPQADPGGENIKEVARLLGLAYQLADDLQDQAEGGSANRMQFLGLPAARAKLLNLTEQVLSLMGKETKNLGFFKNLVLFNYERAGLK